MSNQRKNTLNSLLVRVVDFFDWHAEYLRWPVPDDSGWTEEQVNEWCRMIADRLVSEHCELLLLTNHSIYVRRWVDSKKWKSRVQRLFAQPAERRTQEERH
jgi:hypothetical protein